MSVYVAKKDMDFWHSYYENKDERFYFKEPEITPEEFYVVWINKEKFEKSLTERSEK